MSGKKPSDKTNSNFRQQDSATRKLEKDIDTAGQKQIAQTASVINNSSQEKSQGKLQKQFSEQTNHATTEIRQQEAAATKIENRLDTAEQQQFAQTSSVIADSATNESKSQKQFSNQAREEFRQQDSTTAGKLEKTLDTAQQKQFTQTSSVIADSTTNESKLQKQTSNQVREEFRQQESTAGKLEKTLNTAQQQQFTQTSNVIADTTATTNTKSKLQKQSSNRVREEFRQQETTAGKLEKTLDTAQQKQFTQISSVIADSTTTTNTKSKLQKQSSNQVREEFRQQDSPTGKGKKHLGTVTQQQSTTNKSKMQKSSFERARQKFQQQKSTARKLDKTLYTAEQKKFTHTAKATSTDNSSTDNKLKDRKNRAAKRRYKLAKAVGKGTLEVGKVTLVTSGKALKKGGENFQTELEKGDAEGVKLVSQGVTITSNQSSKSIRWIRKKRIDAKRSRALRKKLLESKNFEKAKKNPLSKVKNVPGNSLRKTVQSSTLALHKGAKKYQEELEKGDEGVKLASQGATQIARASKKLIKGGAKVVKEGGKLGKKSTKLIQARFNKEKMKKEATKAALKKKAVKKKLYAPQRKKAKAAKSVLSSFTNRITNIFKNFGKFKLSDIKNIILTKVAAYFGGSLIGVLPLLLIAVICIVIAAIVGGGASQQQDHLAGGYTNVSAETKKWCSLIEQEAAAQGMEAYVDLVANIIMVESGGTGTRDIMQSSESAGFPPNFFTTEEQSVRQGISHLKNIVNKLQQYNAGYENNQKLLAQAYNFGSAFAGYVGNRGGEYTLEVAEMYSRDIVAPSLGNYTGETYSYVNETSTRLGKPYLYRNGGNFMYGELVTQYGGCSGLGAGVTGDFRIVLDEIEKYEGWPYVWGGKNPTTGFDCSGLISWGLAQIGVSLPSPARNQYDMTVPIDPSEAQPGDLIFFKGTYGGPNHISHVGFYIDENTMYDSNGGGVGYHNWKDPYWQKHYVGIRRIVQ